MERTIHYPAHLLPEQREFWLNDMVQQCLNIGRKRIYRFTPYPGIFDYNDLESSFMQGVLDGLKRVKWNIGNPMIYLIRSGYWRLRTDRYRAIKKKLIAQCEGCGRELKWNEEPCHTAEGESRVARARQKRDPDETIYGESRPNVIMRERIVFVAEFGTDLIETYGEEDEEV